MKIAAHMIAACLLACTASAQAAERRARAGGLKIKHLAFSYTGHMYLDGPALEAAFPIGRPGGGRKYVDGNDW